MKSRSNGCGHLFRQHVTPLPLGLIGVTFGLLVANSTFGFFTILGLISLSGIIINNAIVLLDRIAIEIRDFGRTAAEAILYAAQQRLRPILLTTATVGRHGDVQADGDHDHLRPRVRDGAHAACRTCAVFAAVPGAASGTLNASRRALRRLSPARTDGTRTGCCRSPS